MGFLILTTNTPTNPEVIKLLLEAAKNRKILIEVIDIDKQKLVEVENIKTSWDDLIYREALGAKAKAVEALLLNRVGKLRPVSLYISAPKVGEQQSPWQTTTLYKKRGLRIIPTLFIDNEWFELRSDELDDKVKKLGGFPVVMKLTGRSHGQGVSLISSVIELKTNLKKIGTGEIQKYVLRKFLKNNQHARLIVLGNRVVDSIEYILPNDDFRTNATNSPLVKPQIFSEEVEKLAVDAATIAGFEFGGTDILIDKKSGVGYLAEFNSPCNFARAQMVTGSNISGMIVDYLIQKSKKTQELTST